MMILAEELVFAQMMAIPLMKFQWRNGVDLAVLAVGLHSAKSVKSACKFKVFVGVLFIAFAILGTVAV